VAGTTFEIRLSIAVRAVVGSWEAAAGAIGCEIGWGRAFVDRTIGYRGLRHIAGLPSIDFRF